MEKTSINSWAVILILWSVPLSGLCQTTGSRTITVALPQIALLDIEPTGPTVLALRAPSEAGFSLAAPPENSGKWINYTSAVAVGTPRRSITVSIDRSVPGIDIVLRASAASGSGSGALGTPSGQITLTTVPSVIVSGIGGAYTGTGTGNGHRINLSLRTNNYADLSAATNETIVVTYTIIE